MPPTFQPDPARQVTDLATKVKELARVVRKGKEAPNMRDLRDADGQGAAAGDTWVYGEDGVWRPGSAGGAASDLRLTAPFANLSGAVDGVVWDTSEEAHGSAITWPHLGSDDLIGFATAGNYAISYAVWTGTDVAAVLSIFARKYPGGASVRFGYATADVGAGGELHATKSFTRYFAADDYFDVAMNGPATGAWYLNEAIISVVGPL